jgi:hypothetical protein
MANPDFHFYEPAKGHGLPHDPVQRHRRAAPHRLDLLAGRARRAQPRALQLLQRLQLHAAHRRLRQHRRQGQPAQHRRDGRVRLEPGDPPAGRADEPLVRGRAARGDEFELAGLTPAARTPSRCRAWPRARCPSNAGSRRSCSCEGADGVPVPTWLVLGEVVGVHIARHLLKDGIYDTAAAQPILRGGGPADYFEVSPDNLFKMFRPR